MSHDHIERWFSEAERDRASTAYHEAGHVTAAVLLGLPVARGEGATIAPRPRTFGSADVGRSLAPADLAPLFWAAVAGEAGPARLRRRLESEVLAIMLGPLAGERAISEGLAAPVAEQPLWRRGGGDDELAPQLAYREGVLIHRAVSAAAHEAGEPGWRTDRENVDALLRAASATESEARAYASWLSERALVLLASPRFWLPCTKLARELLKHETLSGRRCAQIVRAPLKVPEASP